MLVLGSIGSGLSHFLSSDQDSVNHRFAAASISDDSGDTHDDTEDCDREECARHVCHFGHCIFLMAREVERSTTDSQRASVALTPPDDVFTNSVLNTFFRPPIA